MPRQVEGDDAKARQRLGIVEEAAILPAVGAGRVQAHERDALAGLLDVDAVRLAGDVEAEIAADGGLESGFCGAHRAPPAAAPWPARGAAAARGNASSSLK